LTIAPLPCAHHLAELGLHAVPHASQVDVDDIVERIVLRFAQRRTVAVYAGIVEGRIEPAIGSDRLLDHRFHLAAVRDVAGDADGVVTRGAETFGRVAGRYLVTIRNDDGCASRGEGLRCCEADAAAGARDECYFPFEICNHGTCPFAFMDDRKRRALCGNPRVVVRFTSGRPWRRRPRAGWHPLRSWRRRRRGRRSPPQPRSGNLPVRERGSDECGARFRDPRT
jgi:hypothetical protein